MEEVEGLPMSGLRRSVRASDLKRYDVGMLVLLRAIIERWQRP
jgi:hypothetical protein